MGNIRILTGIILLTFLGIATRGQEHSAALYNMTLIPDRAYINPAFQPEARFYFGMPGFAMLNVEAGNSGFSFNDVFHETDTGYVVDPDRLLDRLPKVGQLGFNMHHRPLAFGFRFLKNGYFTFDVSNRMSFQFYYPKDMFGLVWKGNAHEDYLGERISFDRLGVEFMMTNEMSVGYSHRIADQVTIGLRGKLISGIANITSSKSEIGFTTQPDNFHLSMDVDYQGHISAPFVDFDSLFATGDPMLTGFDQSMIRPGLDYLKHNRGYAVDIGGTWLILERFLLSASLNDLGYIDWKGNPATFRAAGEFDFSGFDFNPVIAGDESMDDILEELQDSILNSMDFTTSNGSYRQWLNPTSFLGLNVKTYGKDMIGVLLRSRFYKGAWYPRLTLSYNLRVGRWANLSASYGMERNNFRNLGLGVAINAGPFQYYLITDNALAFDNPFSAKTIHVLTGINWVFGTRPKKGSQPSL